MVRHFAPGVVRGRWLRIPNIPCVARQASGFHHLHQRIGIDNAPSGSVDQVGPRLHAQELVPIEEALGGRCQGDIYADQVAFVDQRVQLFVSGAQDLFLAGTEPAIVKVV